LAQAGFLAIHELAHNLVFTRALSNRLFAIAVNAPLVVPFAIAFRDYHLLHHRYQGTRLDLDLPSRAEARLFRGRVGKLAWLCNQLWFYALRPCLLHPLRPSPLVVLNVCTQLLIDAAIVHAWGWGALCFLALSVWLAGGLHPCAGHFLSEHFVLDAPCDRQDTFSYYGPLNWLTWNVGYHVEHHDFPNIPGSRLPNLRRCASAHYADLRVCPSWSAALLWFVLDDDVSLGASRVRLAEDGKTA
jgi:sphingolipid delta-4 desaturase